MSAPEILRSMFRDERESVLDDWSRRRVADYGMPNVYRVGPRGRRRRWQCEWDDWTELGAWRSRFLGRAVRKAQRARRNAIGDALIWWSERPTPDRGAS